PSGEVYGELGSVSRLANRKGSRLNVGPLSAATARSSRAGPGRQDLPLADLTGCFVQSERNAVQLAGPVLIRGPSEEVTNAERAESYEGRAKPYPHRDTLSGGRNAVGSGSRAYRRNAPRRRRRLCRRPSRAHRRRYRCAGLALGPRTFWRFSPGASNASERLARRTSFAVTSLT